MPKFIISTAFTEHKLEAVSIGAALNAFAERHMHLSDVLSITRTDVSKVYTTAPNKRFYDAFKRVERVISDNIGFPECVEASNAFQLAAFEAAREMFGPKPAPTSEELARQFRGTQPSIAETVKSASDAAQNGQQTTQHGQHAPWAALWWKDGKRTNDNPCCSASEPCGHQKVDPYSICATCQEARALKTPHAPVFRESELTVLAVGPQGSGKTNVMRLLARALNDLGLVTEQRTSAPDEFVVLATGSAIAAVADARLSAKDTSATMYLLDSAVNSEADPVFNLQESLDKARATGEHRAERLDNAVAAVDKAARETSSGAVFQLSQAIIEIAGVLRETL